MGGCQTAAAFLSRMGAAVPPKRAAVTSAMIPSAVTSAPRPPRSSPIGPWTRASYSSPKPSSRSASKRFWLVFREPIAPM